MSENGSRSLAINFVSTSSSCSRPCCESNFSKKFIWENYILNTLCCEIKCLKISVQAWLSNSFEYVFWELRCRFYDHFFFTNAEGLVLFDAYQVTCLWKIHLSEKDLWEIISCLVSIFTVGDDLSFMHHINSWLMACLNNYLNVFFLFDFCDALSF